jgi:hypothetical protein
MSDTSHTTFSTITVNGVSALAKMAVIMNIVLADTDAL